MCVLVLGATGFIGSACARALAARGREVRAVARGGANDPRLIWTQADIGRLSAGDWDRLVEGCETVVNCAGVFADSLRDSTSDVHVTGPQALYAACQRKNVKRVVHLSALGVDDGRTTFARTKKKGEEALKATKLDWVILRPSIVIGRTAYGGGALLRGLAALPVLPVEPDLGRVQPVMLDDVVATIVHFADPNAPGRRTLELAGPESMTMAEAIAAFRAWSGWKPARILWLPRWLASPVYASGSFANWLGWRTPIGWSGRREMKRGAEADPSAWIGLVGRPPASLSDFLSATPAGLQDSRFAALFVLKPIIFVITAMFWIGTGIISIGPGYALGVRLLEAGGMGDLSGPSVIAGGLTDIIIGLGIAIRRTARAALWAAIAISLFYAVAGTILLPVLWLDPIGPMLKIWPLIILNMVAIASLRER